MCVAMYQRLPCVLYARQAIAIRLVRRIDFQPVASHLLHSLLSLAVLFQFNPVQRSIFNGLF